MRKIEDIRKTLGYLDNQETPINGCHYLDAHFRNQLNKRCLVYEDQDQNFGDFMAEVGAWINTLTDQGIGRGDRVIILLPLRLELYQLMCALFYIGAVVVSVDSTMPKDKLKLAIEDAKASAIFSVSALLKWTPLLPSLWKLKRYTFEESCFFAKDLAILRADNTLDFKQVDIGENGPVLISFTSGSTGRPKAANRSLEIFLAQKIVSEFFWLHSEDEIDMPFFPTLVLQNLGLGITTIFPDLDFRKIRDFDPSRVIKQMNDYGVTRFSATPMIIKKLAKYIAVKGISIPTLRSVIIGGAEITTQAATTVLAALKLANPNVEVHIIYGSTEVEPISFTPIEDYIENQSIGLKLGKVIDVLDIKINPVTDIFDFNEGLEWGEICLSGPHVIKEYIDNHPANKTTKIRDEDGHLWHLTGDVGYVKDGLVYLLGRLKDCLIIDGLKYPTFHFENALAKIEGVQRAALIQKDSRVICYIEGAQTSREVVKSYLDNYFRNCFEIIYREIPVDSRHFSRVNRNELRSY